MSRRINAKQSSHSRISPHPPNLNSTEFVPVVLLTCSADGMEFEINEAGMSEKGAVTEHPGSLICLTCMLIPH